MAFLKLGNFILSLNMFYTLSHFAQSNPFYPLFPFSFCWRENRREKANRERGRAKKCHLLVSECFFHGSNSSLPAACLHFPFLPDPHWNEAHKSTDDSSSHQRLSLKVTLTTTRRERKSASDCRNHNWKKMINLSFLILWFRLVEIINS